MKSLARQQTQACRPLVKYPTKEAAQRDSARLRPFRCVVCGNWHLGKG